MDYVRILENDTLNINDVSGNTILSIKETLAEGCVTFALSGALSNEIAYEFEDELNAVFSVSQNVKIDLSRLDFIASYGLNTLLKAQRHIETCPEGSMIIIGLNEKIEQVFEENGFRELFDIRI